MNESIKEFSIETLSQIVLLDTDFILLAVLVAVVVILYDSFYYVSRKKLKETGIQPKAVAHSIDGSKNLPIKNYISEIQGLAGRPDALIIENGFIIPVERKPLARKLRDRYVAQLLVYMRLIEEFEGKKPPYGYLILGGNCRRIKIMNTPKRQIWVQGIIDEMRAILAGQESRPTPEARKCSKCDVKNHCKFDASKSSDMAVQINAQINKR